MFQIAQLKFANNLVQGPLAGVSSAPFRRSFLDFEAPAYTVTEMISAYELVHHPKKLQRFTYIDPSEGPVCFQLSGNCPKILYQACQQAERMGAGLIDLNCGCPKPKIRKKPAGSKLLEMPDELLEIVDSMRHATHLPLTVKIRLTDDINRDIELAQSLALTGIDALIIHGRTYQQDYQDPVNLDGINKIKQSIAIPVIANGDVSDNLSLANIQTKTGADAVMISRAGVGKPWLYQSLLEKRMPEINFADVVHLFLKHIQASAILENEWKACMQARKLAKYYFRDWLKEAQWQKLYSFFQLNEIRDYLKNLEGSRNEYQTANTN